jgi:hypothetical protein
MAILDLQGSLYMFDFDFLNINHLVSSINTMEHSEVILKLWEQEKTLAVFCENIFERLKDPALAGVPASIELSRCLEGLNPLMESGRELINALKQSKEDWLDRLKVDEMLINTTKWSLVESMEELTDFPHQSTSRTKARLNTFHHHKIRDKFLKSKAINAVINAIRRGEFTDYSNTTKYFKYSRIVVSRHVRGFSKTKKETNSF